MANRVADAPFAAGAPAQQGAERAAVFVVAAGGTGPALAGDGHGGHAQGVQVVFHGRFAVVVVGGDRAGRLAGASGDAAQGRDQLGRVGRVADLDGVVEHDTVDVVDDLGLVAELDRLVQPSLDDGAGVGGVQADGAGGPGGVGAGQAGGGL